MALPILLAISSLKPFPYADLPANEYADTVMLPTPSCLDASTPNE
ncbi:hypothetical protein [Adlercreutzia caecimuris]|nr:hypothetical protein [Adlercreutzia caecimuris]